MQSLKDYWADMSKWDAKAAHVTFEMKLNP